MSVLIEETSLCGLSLRPAPNLFSSTANTCSRASYPSRIAPSPQLDAEPSGNYLRGCRAGRRGGLTN